MQPDYYGDEVATAQVAVVRRAGDLSGAQGGHDGMAHAAVDVSAAGLDDGELLGLYCARAMPPDNTSEEALTEADRTWIPVREWISTRSDAEIRQGVETKGDSSMTALHLACRNFPPIDVIEEFLSVSPDVAGWKDAFDWLPIHYACASRADTEIVRLLASACPASKTAVERRGRTPLHLALGFSNFDVPISPEMVKALISDGAAGYADDDHMLPLHCACAYGCSKDTLIVLTAAFPDAVTAVDKFNRTPLHFALSNASLPTAPTAVQHLLELNPILVNPQKGAAPPLLVLAEFSTSLRGNIQDAKHEAVQNCLDHLLDANPEPNALFFSALQLLPGWLSEKAVVKPSVQKILNEKSSSRFPTLKSFLELYIILCLWLCFYFTVEKSIALRVDPTTDEGLGVSWQIMGLYLVFFWYIVEWIPQLVTLVCKFRITQPSKFFGNLMFLLLMLFLTDIMRSGNFKKEIKYFRALSTLCSIFPAVKLLLFFRNIFIKIAIFVSAIIYVVQRLVAFIISLLILLLMFTLMFQTMFYGTYDGIDYCSPPHYQDLYSDPPTETSNIFQQDDTCAISAIAEANVEQAGENHPFCNIWLSFLRTFTMLLGEVGGDDVKEKTFPQIIYIIFFFVMVIILANVLIAIITDSYKVIQDQRAAIVFLQNRLSRVADNERIINGEWKQKLNHWFRRKSRNNTNSTQKEGLEQQSTNDNDGLGNIEEKSSIYEDVSCHDEDDEDHINNTGGDNNNTTTNNNAPQKYSQVDMMRRQWKRFMDLFTDDFDVHGASLTFNRIVVIFVIILWFIVGFIAFGFLWPPQIREMLFKSKIYNMSQEEMDNNERKLQIKETEMEVEEIKQELYMEQTLKRNQVLQMKRTIAQHKGEIANEMKEVKRLMAFLFEQQMEY